MKAQHRPVRILIVGPDGSGKSTLAREFVQGLRRQGREVVHVHFLPHAEPSTPAAAVPNPHLQEARPNLLSLVALLRRFAVYASSPHVGYFGRSREDVVVQERGWYDQLVDPVRYRLTESVARLVPWFGRLLPRPCLTVTCGGDPASIAERKGEISLSSTSDQLERLTALPSRPHWSLEIDATEETIEASTDLIRRAAAASSQAWAVRLRRVSGLPRRLNLHSSQRGLHGTRVLYTPSTLTGRVRVRISNYLPRTASSVLPVEIVMLAQVMSSGSLVSVVIMQSPGRRRWVICTEEGDGTRRVMKIGRSTDRSLQSEREHLQRLDGRLGSLRIPRVVDSANENGYHGFSMPLEHDLVGRRPSVDVERAIDAAAILAGHEGGEPITHGDLSPWNLHGPWLIDWEAATDYRQGDDFCHYVVAAAYMRGGLTISEATGLLSGGSAPLSDLASRIGVRTVELERDVRRALDLLCGNDDGVGETARKVRAALNLGALPHAYPSVCIGTDPRGDH